MLDSNTLSTQDPSSSSAQIPLGCEWILDIYEKARLPQLGLPVNWEETAKKHSLILINPETGESFSALTGKKGSSNPVGFIKATKGVHSMPGTETPASARVELYNEPKLQESFVKDSMGNTLVPCIAHGDYVKVEALQTDHVQAKDNIRRRQNKLVELLNINSQFAEHIMKQPGMEKFFVKYQNKYYGTLFFYEVYFNDIDNLWLICSACNLHKSNQETLNWLKEQWLYGQEFLNYLEGCQIQKSGIIEKDQGNKGIAEIAIQWFWNRHANYISTAKKLYENLITPIQTRNQKVDHIVGAGNHARAERLHSSLDMGILFASSMFTTKLGMPKGGDESPHSSSDEDLRLTPPVDDNGQPLNITPEIYQSAAKKALSDLPNIAHDILQQALIDEAKAAKIRKVDDKPIDSSGKKELKQSNLKLWLKKE